MGIYKRITKSEMNEGGKKGSLEFIHMYEINFRNSSDKTHLRKFRSRRQALGYANRTHQLQPTCGMRYRGQRHWTLEYIKKEAISVM